MKPAAQPMEKRVVRAGGRNGLATVVTLAMASLLAVSARAQNTQFRFDRSGDLQAQIQITGDLAAPQIVSQPQTQIVPSGGRASFSVAVADARGVSYQWLFNGNPISGATTDTLLLTNVSAAKEGLYSVSLQNSVDALVSLQAPLYLDADANSLPDSWETTYFGGYAATYGDTDGDGVSNLQEFYDGTNPTNATSVLYHITIYRDGGKVDISPNQTALPKGQVVTLTAIGSDATPFHAWTGDIVSRSNAVTFTLNSNLTLFAHFQPFTLKWTNPVSADWNDATNWTPNLVPSTNDDALLTYNLTLTENSDVDLHNLTVTSGTLIINGHVSVRNNLELTNALVSVNSQGALLAQNLILNGGSANFAGQYACTNNLVMVDSTVTLNGASAITPQNVVFSGGTLGGTQNVTVLKAMTWTGGRMRDEGRTMIAPGATLSISNSSEVFLDSGRALDNAGAINWSGSAAFALNYGPYSRGGYITNEPGGVFTVLTPQRFYNLVGDGARFDNAGTLRISSGGAVDRAILNNYGLVDITGGTFAFTGEDGGGVNVGVVNVAAGATFNLADGTFGASPGSLINGAGVLLVSGGSHSLAGTVTVTGTNTFTGGSANFTGDYRCTNILMIAGGTAAFNGTGVVAPQSLILNGGILRGIQDVTVRNQMLWTGGFMREAGRTIIAPEAILTISNSSDVILDLGRALDNRGTVNWSGGASFDLNYGPYSGAGYITNEPGAVFNVLVPQQFYNLGGGGARFDNAGTLHVPGGGTTMFYQVPLNNYNLVDVLGGGALTLNHNDFVSIGTNVGVIDIPAEASFNLANGIFNTIAGSSISGAGSLLVSGGGTHTLAGTVALAGTNTFTGGSANFTGNYRCTNALVIAGGTAAFNGTGVVAPQSLILNGGTLRGTQDVTVRNQMMWTSGFMREAGRTIIAPEAILTISNSSDVILDLGRALDNRGTVNWSGGASFDLNYGPYSGAGHITNEPSGVFTVLAPQQFYNLVGDGARFDNAGTLKIPGGGTTAFNGVPLTNYNLIDLRTGALAANGGYGSTSNSVLYSAWAGTNAGVNFGQLRAIGTATVAGTIKVGLTNGYVPAINDSFALVSADARNGTFSNFLYPSNQIQLTLTTTATAIIATVNNVLVSPTALVLHLEKPFGSSIGISWPTNFPGYHLQYVTSLTDTNWVDAGLSISVVGTNFVVTDFLSNTQQQRYYRLSNQ